MSMWSMVFKRIGARGLIGYPEASFIFCLIFVRLPPFQPTHSALDEPTLEQLVREHLFNIEGLWESTGFRQIPVIVNKQPYKGISTYSFSRKIAYSINAITAFSNKPLIYIAYLGLLIIIPLVFILSKHRIFIFRAVC